MVGVYSFPRIILIIGGFRIHGFGPDDAITIEDQAEVETQVGADGEASVSLSADESRMVNITIQPTSPSYRILAQLARDQRDPSTPLIPALFSLVDTVNGDKLTDINCIFKNLPFPSKGKNVAPVVFKVFLPKPTTEYGALLAGI